jgi:hypothetical protein
MVRRSGVAKETVVTDPTVLGRMLGAVVTLVGVRSTKQEVEVTGTIMLGRVNGPTAQVPDPMGVTERAPGAPGPQAHKLISGTQHSAGRKNLSDLEFIEVPLSSACPDRGPEEPVGTCAFKTTPIRPIHFCQLQVVAIATRVPDPQGKAGRQHRPSRLRQDGSTARLHDDPRATIKDVAAAYNTIRRFVHRTVNVAMDHRSKAKRAFRHS